VTQIDLAKREVEKHAFNRAVKARRGSGFGVCVKTRFRVARKNEAPYDPAPEGRANLAQRFSAGKSGKNDLSPGGTTESSSALFSPGQTRFGGLGGRAVFLVMLGAALLLGAGCKRQPGSERSFFPASNQVAGWVRSGETRTFEAADLWKYIDGEAERYLKAGVQKVSATDYKFQNKVDAVVDIYTMGNAEGARKVFESEPAGDAKPVQLGDDARLYGQSLVFRKGAFLVRIVAYEESAETQQALLQLGQGIELRLAR
jgi:uncharacterized protein DUF6599